jgi:hypothetical protein
MLCHNEFLAANGELKKNACLLLLFTEAGYYLIKVYSFFDMEEGIKAFNQHLKYVLLYRVFLLSNLKMNKLSFRQKHFHVI